MMTAFTLWVYEAVINLVGGILEPYDYDKLFPVFGFGGIP